MRRSGKGTKERLISQTGAAVGAEPLSNWAPVPASDLVTLNEEYRLRLSGVSVSPVPEPETYAMLLAGLGLVGAMARRRKVFSA